VLVMPPYFAHLSPTAEIIAHFAAIDARSTLPIVLYNIPGNAGNALTPAIADELADMDKVVAIKESSGDWLNFHGTLTRVKDRIRVFCGPSSTLGVRQRWRVRTAISTVFPMSGKGAWIWHKTKAGADGRGLGLAGHRPDDDGAFHPEGRTLYPATKAAMNFLGLPGGGVPRPPLRPLAGCRAERAAGWHGPADWHQQAGRLKRDRQQE
jgi:dihydrodipicolinate synthase/N-acetylneuraminate lyase